MTSAHFLEYYYNVLYAIKYPVETFKDWKYRRNFRPGDIIEDCRYHPCVIHTINSDGDIHATSMVSGGMSSCSLWHCGVTKMTLDQALRFCKIYSESGYDAAIDDRYGKEE